ncbi:MAG: LamG domain-containing protein, partial [Mariniphaga sp.]
LLGADLVGWWNFDDEDNRYKDLSGYGNNGSCTSCPTLVDGVPGISGKAMSFNGSNQYVSIEDFQNESLHNGITISAWIKLSEPATDRTILAKANNSNGLEGFAFIKSSSYPQKIGLNLNTGGWKYSGDFFIVDTWHHVIAVLQPGDPNATVTFYANGSISGTKNQSLGKSLSDITTSSTLDIGKRPSYFFNGLIDDVRIYSRALTAYEVQTLYAQTKDNYLAEEQ